MGQQLRFWILAAIVTLSQGHTFSSPQSDKPPTSASTTQPASNQAAAPQSPSPPASIPVANIASEAQAASLELSRIEHDVNVAVKSLDVEEDQLAASAKSVARIHAELEAAGNRQNWELANFRQELAGFESRLSKLQKALTPRSEVVEARREDFARIESLWKATSRSSSGPDVPPSSRALIRSTLQRIDRTGSLLRRSRTILLNAQNRVSQQQIAVEALLAQVNDAISTARSRLLELESKPLWTALRSGWSELRLRESVKRAYVIRIVTLFPYVRENWKRFGAHLIISLLLIWLLVSVSRRTRAWGEPFGLDSTSAKVLPHPVAAGLVVSLLLTFSIYPTAPLTLYRLPFLLMVFPLARVVAGSVSREDRTGFYFLATVFLLARLDWLFSSSELVLRIFLLILSCLGFFGAVWIARKDRTAVRIGTRRLRRARLHLLRLAALVLLSSIVLNVLGAVRLAALLAGACIASAYSAVAIFAGVLVLEAFLLPLLQSPVAQMSVALREQSQELRRRSSTLIRLAGLLTWAFVTLMVFGLSRSVWDWLSALVFLQWSLGQVRFSLGGILLFIAIIWLSILVARLAAFVTEKDLLSRMKLPQGIPATISVLVRNVIIAAGFVLALASAGVEWNQVALLASAVGVGIGLGLQQLVASFIAGVILMVERLVRVGDIVALGGVEGTVTRIGLRSSTIAVWDGSELIVPNSRMISAELTNWTLSNQLRRIEIQVGVALGSDAAVVLSVLNDVVCQHPRVIRTPAPEILFLRFGESWLIFVARFFTMQNGWTVVNSEVMAQIDAELRRAGIEIAAPRREIRIEKGSAEAPQETSQAGDADTHR